MKKDITCWDTGCEAFGLPLDYFYSRYPECKVCTKVEYAGYIQESGHGGKVILEGSVCDDCEYNKGWY